MFNKKKISSIVIAFFVSFILFAVLQQFKSWYEAKIAQEKEHVVVRELTTYSASITQAINKRILLLELLRKHIQIHLSKHLVLNIHDKELQHFIKMLYDTTDGIRVFQVSPAGIHKFVYPLKGNESTLGRNLFQDSRQEVQEMLEVAIKTKEITFNAPYSLRQGGFGIVSRVAISKNDFFWGFAVMILDMNTILKEAQFISKSSNFFLAIEKDGKIIYGDKNIREKNPSQVQLNIKNQELTLLASSKEPFHSIGTLFIQASIIVIALLSGVITYILLKRQEKLESSVEETLKTLEERNQELNLLIQKAPNPIMLFNEEGKILITNEVWQQLSGYEKDEIDTIEKWVDIAFEENKEAVKARIFALFKIDKTIIEGEQEIRTKEGNLRTWTFNSTPFGIINEKKTVLTSAMDVTELKEKDRIMLHQSKMASLGEMLENIAHQWRQPLSIISTASTGVLFAKDNGLLKDETLEDSMVTINQSVQYLSKTIDYFRAFLMQKSERDFYYIENIVEKTISLVQSKFKNRNIKIIKNIHNIEIFSVENDLIQILMNLLNNAKDALELRDDNRYIFIEAFEQDKKLIIIFKDNAGGIKNSIIEKIFEPYFTTKQKTQGTGIGLFIIQEIIRKQLNGSIEVENETFEYKNEEFKGAKFTIELPL